MTKAEYDRLQTRLSAMLDHKRLHYKGISGKRAEGYEIAILAVKSMIKDEYAHQKDQLSPPEQAASSTHHGGQRR